MTNVSALTAISSDFYEEGEEGFESSESGQIEQAATAAPQSQRTTLAPTAVSDQVASSIAQLVAEASDAASAAFVSEAGVLLPELMNQHQGHLGYLAASICATFATPAGGSAFNQAFQAGLAAAKLPQHSFKRPATPDFLKIVSDAAETI